MGVPRRELLTAIGSGVLLSVSGCVVGSGGSGSHGSTENRDSGPTAEGAARASSAPSPTPSSDTATSTKPSNQTTSIPKETPATGNCPDEPIVPDADPEPGGIDFEPVPDPPESITDEDAVVAYVEAYETAWKQRAITTKFNGAIVSASVGTNPTVRESSDDMTLVELSPAYIYGRVDLGDEKPGHFDDAEHLVRYLVTPDGVWRAREYLGVEGPTPDPDPRPDGELIVCF